MLRVHQQVLLTFCFLTLSACALDDETVDDLEGSPTASVTSALTFASVGSAIPILSSEMCLTQTPSNGVTYVTQQPCVSAPQAWFTPVPAIDPGYYEIKSGGRCLDAIGNTTRSGGQFQLYPCTGNNNQQFRFNRVSANVWEIRPKLASALCLDIEYGDAVAGRYLQQFACHGGANQRFRTRPLLKSFERTCDTRYGLRTRWASAFDPIDIHVGAGEVWNHASRSLTLDCEEPNLPPWYWPWRETLTCPTATSIIELSRQAPERIRVRCYQ
ncbi:MAG: RICIN domain-containing protein [Kofleriaceae bacterium]